MQFRGTYSARASAPWRRPPWRCRWRARLLVLGAAAFSGTAAAATDATSASGPIVVGGVDAGFNFPGTATGFQARHLPVQQGGWHRRPQDQVPRRPGRPGLTGLRDNGRPAARPERPRVRGDPLRRRRRLQPADHLPGREHDPRDRLWSGAGLLREQVGYQHHRLPAVVPGLGDDIVDQTDHSGLEETGVAAQSGDGGL